jgi:Holliday junction resolvase
MTTPEKKVKDKVKAILKELGVYYFMPATHGYGSSGVPDIVACINGRFVGIECKAGDGKPTALQEKNLVDIMNSGGVAIIINEQEIGALKLFLNTLALTKTVAGMLTDYTNWGKK